MSLVLIILENADPFSLKKTAGALFTCTISTLFMSWKHILNVSLSFVPGIEILALKLAKTWMPINFSILQTLFIQIVAWISSIGLAVIFFLGRRHLWLAELTRLYNYCFFSFLNLCSPKLMVKFVWPRPSSAAVWRMKYLIIHAVLPLVLETCLSETAWAAVAFGYFFVQNPILFNVQKFWWKLFDEHPINLFWATLNKNIAARPSILLEMTSTCYTKVEKVPTWVLR